MLKSESASTVDHLLNPPVTVSYSTLIFFVENFSNYEYIFGQRLVIYSPLHIILYEYTVWLCQKIYIYIKPPGKQHPSGPFRESFCIDSQSFFKHFLQSRDAHVKVASIDILKFILRGRFEIVKKIAPLAGVYQACACSKTFHEL